MQRLKKWSYLGLYGPRRAPQNLSSGFAKKRDSNQSPQLQIDISLEASLDMIFPKSE